MKPLIKLIIPAGAGVLLAKAGMLPVAGSRACSQIILNITLPSLLFSKVSSTAGLPRAKKKKELTDRLSSQVIASFTNDNISALGPIFLVGIIYMLVSGVLGLIIRATCRVPGNFRWGLLSAAIWSNWGDLPTAVVGSVCAGAPFVEGQAAADLAIAYVRAHCRLDRSYLRCSMTDVGSRRLPSLSSYSTSLYSHSVAPGSFKRITHIHHENRRPQTAAQSRKRKKAEA